MKALVIAHRHPDFSVGGAELAAYNHFKALQRREDVVQATFLAATDQKSLTPGAIMPRRAEEYLWRQGIGNWFRWATADLQNITSEFRAFLIEKSPDFVFVHHFAGAGVEILKEIRRTLPECRLVLTLHEYIAICARDGQMVKNNTRRLCYRETIEDCHLCFPNYSPEDFWLRKHYIQKHFEAADAFVAPSEFLRQRYIDWGIPPASIAVIENGQPTFEDSDEPANDNRPRNRFGFFAQITEYKGADLLLQAMHMMPRELRAKLTVEIHGANLELQSQRIQELVERYRTPLIAEGTLRWPGAYEPRELYRRMSKVDWVIVPSIWWENSPMVIQEAFSCGKPVICANIGGMAEKVQNRVTGLHFEAQNALDLADVLVRAATEPGLWKRLAVNISRPISYDESAEEYMRLVS